MKFVHGEPIIEFTMEEVNQFTIEEGLHQAVIMKFSYGKPDVHEPDRKSVGRERVFDIV